MKIDNDPIVLKALNMYLKELDKISAKYQKQRAAEVAKIESKFGSEMDADDLADMYGYGSITRNEYEATMKILEQNGDAKEAARDLKTPLSEVVRMVKTDIRNLNAEIADIEREIEKEPAARER